MTSPETPSELPLPLRPLALQCYEYRRPVGAGRTQSHFATARDASGNSVEVVLKLRDPGPALGDGHYGGTSLAAELIFAVIARACGLNVPDYAVVEVGPIFANGVPNDATAEILNRNIGKNFGSIRLRPAPVTWQPSYRPQRVELREALESVISFDSTIVNGDRKAVNPNLLWDGKDSVHVIDHGLACPAYLQPVAFQANPLSPDALIVSHSGFGYLQSTGQRYERLHSRWAGLMDADFFRALRASIPADWERQPGDLSTIFQFLECRHQRFSDISAQLRRVVQ